VYFYCNNRLIAKEIKTRDVGYFVSAEAGVPHPNISLCRELVRLERAGERYAMDQQQEHNQFWASCFSKSATNSDRADETF
jgi:hypothetical protein